MDVNGIDKRRLILSTEQTMKMHLNLAVSDLAKSVSFYRALLQQPPAKRYDDYALFVCDAPAVELALDLASHPIIEADAHYGIAVTSAETVRETAERLKAGGYRADVELDETCCYARQTKVWTSDPDGRRWETYVVHEETEERNDDRACCESTCGV